ncbi:MAG: 6,7-dimethyl-8-ribityllumazine synthase [bacterium]|nr:6,7-dimethyl-8-ribityllumazine synthase [Candidatus Auribacterota bacterium]MDD5645358.1 6,7-dimethyl-8-ribityllumazine synthase [bacterium]
MGKIISGKLNVAGKKVALVVSRFNEFITAKLVEGANDCLMRHGAGDKDIDIVWVPGSFEIPAVAKKIAKAKKYNAIICLGAVIRGDTPHFDYVCKEVSKGISALAMESEIPVVFGIVTTDSLEQAIERAGTKSGNKGFDAALTAIELINLYEEIK